MSKVLACPLKKNGENLHYYKYYPQLRTKKPWMVPTLYGRMPKKPARDGDDEEKGKYALFAMLLFRPWRGLRIPDFLQKALCNHSGVAVATAWQVVHREYERWRSDDIDKIAQPYL